MGGVATEPQVTPLAAKAARHELRKAQTLELLAVIAASQEAHGHNMNLLREEMALQRNALAEHTAHQLRLSASFWSRVRWLMVGQ